MLKYDSLCQSYFPEFESNIGIESSNYFPKELVFGEKCLPVNVPILVRNFECSSQAQVSSEHKTGRLTNAPELTKRKIKWRLLEIVCLKPERNENCEKYLPRAQLQEFSFGFQKAWRPGERQQWWGREMTYCGRNNNVNPLGKFFDFCESLTSKSRRIQTELLFSGCCKIEFNHDDEWLFHGKGVVIYLWLNNAANKAIHYRYSPSTELSNRNLINCLKQQMIWGENNLKF